ncbi:MAG: hypothetical protein M3132_11460 [Actinomycetia bacterium]|nr:hypothetical protein [Actinomycetes bacterium]
MQLLDELRHVVADRGGQVGVTDLAPFPDVESEIVRRSDDGTRGRLGFTFRDPVYSTQPRGSFPWGTSIVVVALPYLQEGDGVSPGRTVARFADGDRYDVMREVLSVLATRITTAGYRAETVFDDDRIIDRAVAQRAGVGWSGKSTMILTPGFGPWVLLGSVVTDAELALSEPMIRTCGTCDACVPACPTGAIVAPGVLDARRCLAAVFQTRGDIPIPLRSLAEGRIYGCDDCLTSCPPGHRALESVEAAPPRLRPSAVLGMNDRDLDAATRHWYVPGCQVRFVRRNALVALGNTGNIDDLGTVAGYAGHPDPMLRRHALWALHKIAPDIFTSVAARILGSDPDEQVRSDVAEMMTS